MAAPIKPSTKPFTEERKRKISEAIKKKHQDKEYRRKFLEGIEKFKGVMPEGLKRYQEENDQNGHNNPNWKGGRTSQADLIRKSRWYKELVKNVYKRDDFTCTECGKRGGDLNAHHIVPFIEIINDMDKLKDETNLTTLCVSCHKNTESYGRQSVGAR